MEYRIEQLARTAGVAVDTIRFYQGKGLLEAPRREGRVTWYGEPHVERLKRIKELQQQGFTLTVIQRFLAGELEASDEALVAAVTRPAAPQTLTLGELAERSASCCRRSTTCSRQAGRWSATTSSAPSSARHGSTSRSGDDHHRQAARQRARPDTRPGRAGERRSRWRPRGDAHRAAYAGGGQRGRDRPRARHRRDGRRRGARGRDRQANRRRRWWEPHPRGGTDLAEDRFL